MFLHDLSVPFTNNEAEQGLRMPKVREKVSGCFRTKKGVENYCILRSVTETGRKTGTGNFGYLKGRACSIHQASKDCLIAPTSGLDLSYLNAPGKKLSNAPWERHWAVVNLLPKSVQMRAKDRVAIPANLYRIKQIDCPWKSAKYRLRDRRRNRAVTLCALFLDLNRRDRIPSAIIQKRSHHLYGRSSFLK